jgi:hypothetical protein
MGEPILSRSYYIQGHPWQSFIFKVDQISFDEFEIAYGIQNVPKIVAFDLKTQ